MKTIYNIIRNLVNKIGLNRRCIKERNATGLNWRIKHGKYEKYVQYACSICGDDLEPGPSGAGTNQVCNTCRINYGCLPGAPER